MPISFPGYKGFKNGAFVVNGAPEVERFPLDLHEDFVEMPSPVVGTLMQSLLPLFELLRKQGTKPIPPEANGFITDVDPSFME